MVKQPRGALDPGKRGPLSEFPVAPAVTRQGAGLPDGAVHEGGKEVHPRRSAVAGERAAFLVLDTGGLDEEQG